VGSVVKDENKRWLVLAILGIAQLMVVLDAKPTPADLLSADVHGYTTAFYWAGGIFILAAIAAFALLRSPARPPAPGTVPVEPEPGAEPAEA